jgi:hypothetical protein
MDVPISPENPSYNIAYAQRVLTRIDRQTTFSAEQVGSMGKWLMASLLAVNGAGALAALNTNDPSNTLSSIFFGIGVIFALLSGVAMEETYNRISLLLFEYDEYWMPVTVHGQRVPEIE